MKKKLSALPLSAVLYVIFTVLMIIVISLKANYYIDEIYSYGLSNYSGDGIDMAIEYGKTYTPGASVYMDYMAVTDNRFSYANVWEKQTQDVHPPLYYMILHTICSLFPNTYSKWYAGIINIAFTLLTLYVLRKLIPLLTDNKYIFVILSVTFVFMTGILRSVVYFRMYIMAMLWITLLTYILIHQVERTQDRRFYLFLYLTTTAGALTHYYIIVYTFLISCVYCVYLLWNNRIRETLLFSLSMALAAATSIAIFPAMIEHMFFGYRGTEAIENLTSDSSYWESLKTFFDLISRHMFGHLLGYLIIALIIAALIRYLGSFIRLWDDEKTESICYGFSRTVIIRYVLIFVPCFLYFMLVSKMSFVTSDRYIVPIYAVSYAGILCMACTLLCYFLDKKAFIAATVILMACLTGGSYAKSGWQYLFKESDSLLAEAKTYSSKNCICVFDGKTYMLYPEFAEYCNYKSITFITSADLAEQGIKPWASPEGVIVSFVSAFGNQDLIIQTLMAENEYYQSEKLGTFGYDNTYFLHN